MLDRVTGREVAAPDSTIALGRYLASGQAATRIYLGSDAAGRAHDVHGKAQGSIGREAEPDDLLRASVQGIAGEIGQLREWSELADHSPLIPDIDSWLVERPLENEIRRRLPHLEAVCRRPEERLVIEEERVPVGRARRTSGRAFEVLASRTEDWQRRTLRGVEPRRVLALRREQVVDFYENRVAARLVEHLVKYLDGRLREVGKVLRQLEDLERYSTQLSELQSWRVQDRASWLLGKVSMPAETRVAARTHLAEMRALRTRVGALMDSRLYRDIRRSGAIATTLIMTNLFVNDQRYRHVASLWRAWADLHTAVRTPEEVFQAHQDFCRAYEDFCFLLVALSLTGLGFANDGSAVPSKAESPITLTGGLGRVSLVRNPVGVIELSSDRRVILRVVPLADPTLRGGTDSTRTRAAALRHPSGVTADRTVILYPGETDQRLKLDLATAVSLNTLGNDGSGDDLGGVGLLVATPLELNSGERVTRAIRWALASDFVDRYPPTVRVESDVASALPQGTAWCALQGNDLIVRRPPRDDELSGMKRAISQLAERDAATAAARRAGARSFSKASSSIDNAVRELEPLLTCPTCLRIVPPSVAIEPRADGTFWVTCPSCAGEWGTQRCGACSRRLPVLRARFREEVDPDSVDNEFGGDVLSIPCWRRTRENTYICPYCGHCGEEGQATIHGDCQRCCDPESPRDMS